MNSVKIAVFFGGMPIKKDEQVLKMNCPHIVVGTPGRILALARQKTLGMKHIKHFVLDECDKMLETLGTCVIRELVMIFIYRKLIYQRSKTIFVLIYKLWTTFIVELYKYLMV